MEALLVLAGLFFIGGPILVFLLLIGARSRISLLERKVEYLYHELQALSPQGETRVAAAPAPVAAEPAMSVTATAAPTMPPAAEPPEVSATLAAEDLRGPDTLPGETAAVAEAPDTPEYAPEPTPAPEPEYYEPSPPPAWLIKAKEWLFGGNLVAKAGLLILFLGVSFLLKYAAARVTVPIEFRLAGITLADIGLLLWGWRIRESRPNIALPVQGAALGILMLVTFGAFKLYDLIPGGLAFALLFFLTFFTCVLAVLQNAVWLAVFGIAGGFAAPILTSTGQGSHVALFSYYALLNAGILAIALKRSWRLLNLLGFAFTFLISTAWGVLKYRPEDYLSAQGFLVLFFLFYVAIAILYASREAPRLKHYVDGTLVFGTPLLAFGLQFGLVHDVKFGLAFSALALGLFYIGLTLALWRRRGSSLKLLVESFLALGIVFGTLAIPFALDGRWTSAAWALEGAGIVWIGLRQRQTLAWVFGVLVQIGAWISFVGSVSGLTSEVAANANLWLGFLLLAGTGLAMAINFRKQLDAGEPLPPVVGVLATLFLGGAALWLLLGAWVEIHLHAHGTLQATLFAASGVIVAGLLGWIANRQAWPVARLFALIAQGAAGLLFAALVFGIFYGYAPSSTGNLFDGPFLGALLLALGAGASSLAFHRQQTAEGEAPRGASLATFLLVWTALWWFGLVLPSLADWGEANVFRADGQAVAHNLFLTFYSLLLAAGALAFAKLASRLDWPPLRWLAAAVWPGLLVSTIAQLETLHAYGLHLPGWVDWAGFAALWLAGEWLLARGRNEDWLSESTRPALLRGLHTLRTVAPWVLIWPLGHHLVVLGLQVDAADQAALLAESGWFTAGSWARYLPAWAMMAYVAALIPRARAERWPTAPVAEWYRDALITLGALWSLALAVLWNFTQNGRMEPLPYLPLLNPLDLTTGFAALLALAAWRLRQTADAADSTEDDGPSLLPRFAALAGYVWFNLMLLRTAAHYLDIAYQFEPLFRSQFVQAMLSLVWSATALVLMRFAAQRRIRLPWMTGAALLALVVAKLFFVDLSNVGGIERIVSFLGVGALMLAIGYLAPFPSAAGNEAEAPASGKASDNPQEAP